jgi:hypothetical protein
VKSAVCVVGLQPATFVGELAAGSPALLVSTGVILLTATILSRAAIL